MGASAGTNIAAPTIKTTNDMPIVEPASFAALNLVPFQINPHYLGADPHSTHNGETRETRLEEFLEENDTKVLGLGEGTSLRVTGRSQKPQFIVEGQPAMVDVPGPAVMFQRGEAPQELQGNLNQQLSDVK